MIFQRSILALVTYVMLSPVAQAANIVETAQKAGAFKTLIAAADAAGLVSALSGGGPITVFAPDDAAFRKLPKGTVERLLKPENKAQLQAILAYHVLPQAVAARNVPRTATRVATLNKAADLTVQRGSNGAVHVNGARVTTADVKADNGVIHVINRVLIPR